MIAYAKNFHFSFRFSKSKGGELQSKEGGIGEGIGTFKVTLSEGAHAYYQMARKSRYDLYNY